MDGPIAPDWSLPVAVLAIGLVVGAVLVWWMRGRPSVQAGNVLPLEIRDLLARRDGLLAQLRELQDTADKREPDQLARERYALELAAARVLLALEERGSAPAPVEGATPAAASSPAAAPSSVRGFLWGVGTAGALALLLYLVSGSATERAEGGSVTGGMASGPGAEPPAPAPGLAALRAQVAAHPEDPDVRLELAQGMLAERDLMGVFNETQAVLQKQPGHPRALALQSLVRLAMGQAEKAEEMLNEALATDPDLIEGYVHLAVVHAQTGRAAAAAKDIEEARRRFPDQREALDRVASELLSAEPEAAPANAAPTPAMVAPAVAPAPAGADLAGVIELDPSAQVGAGALVFVTIRPAGQEGGPPVAVKRLAPAFPLRFSVSAADSMMGQPIPDRMRVEVRIDSDGDALSRSPEDPAVLLADVGKGTTDLRVVLGRR